ncbi:ATP-dependent RNA helicase dbp7 [Savitreella phatthalungensis]
MSDDSDLLVNLDTSLPAYRPRKTSAAAAAKGGKWTERARARKQAVRYNRKQQAQLQPELQAEPESEQQHSQTGRDVPLPPSSATQVSSRPAQEPRDAESNKPRLLKRKRDTPGQVSVQPKSAVAGPRQIISSLFNFHEDRLPNVEPTPKKHQPDTPAVLPTNAPLADLSSFDDADLPADLLAVLKEKQSITAPTLVQKKSLPQLLAKDQDVFIRAQTGSGKTLAYLLPILARLAQLDESMHKRSSGTFAVIIAPTRELAQQIYAVVLSLCTSCRTLRWAVPCLLVGGERKKSEKARLRKGASIVVGTPGRLKDHLDSTQALDLAQVRYAVLDEADRLMDLGFEETVTDIISALELRAKFARIGYEKLPTRRVTVLCSATVKAKMSKLGERALRDAVMIEGGSMQQSPAQQDDGVTGTESIPAQLKQEYIIVPTKLRTVTLVALLRNALPRCKRVIVFLSCGDSVDWHFEALTRQSIKGDVAEGAGDADRTVWAAPEVHESLTVLRLHGNLSQPVRRSTLKQFETLSGPAVLLSTDVASRGLDTQCDLVIQLDPPFAIDDYVHRVGRTARAGKQGRAVLVLLKTEAAYIDHLQKNLEEASRELHELNARSTLRLAFGGKEFEDEATKWQLSYEGYAASTSDTKSLSARAYQAHIRAYTTHTAAERKFFALHDLQLGHLAKVFGLREAPSKITAHATGEAVSKKGKRAVRRKDDDDMRRETAAERMRTTMAAQRKSMAMGVGGGADDYNLM